MPDFDTLTIQARINYLRALLTELRGAKDTGKDLDTVYKNYENELNSLLQRAQPQPKVNSEKIHSHNTSWTNWYKENNILLLLYLGALLIVLSAATFVAFNWSQISGLTKVFGLIFVTASFLSSGLYIYKQSVKLKIAGVTFSTIGALLIPFNGIAIYNFILIDKSYFGLIWALTSLVSLLTYFGFLKIFKENFFKYVSVLATLSFVESFVNIGNLDNKYYILGSILTGFILMILSIRSQEKSQQGSVAVYNMAAHIIIPASLVMGLLIAVSQNELFTQVTSLAVLMAAVFYLLNYFIYKDKYSPYAFSFLMFLFAAVYRNIKNEKA